MVIGNMKNLQTGNIQYALIVLRFLYFTYTKETQNNPIFVQFTYNVKIVKLWFLKFSQ